MEKNCVVNKKLIPSHNEEFIREVNYGSTASEVISSRNTSLLLEILKTRPSKRISHRVIVTIKPRVASITKTLYVADRDYKYSEVSETNISTKSISSVTAYPNEHFNKSYSNIDKKGTDSAFQIEQTETSSSSGIEPYNISNISNHKYDSKSVFVVMNETDVNFNKFHKEVTKVDKATLIITNSTSESSNNKSGSGIISQLSKKINYLEKKVLQQEKVFRSYIAMHLAKIVPGISRSKRPNNIYVDQYSHIPESSGFSRNKATKQPSSNTTTMEKEHHSEQYGRDFTTYDGITSRGKRQCASVPLRRDRFAKVAAERVQKIRHKLNPVRDYRLMDTVHYLAQGEFAPRDDGIKLTPSREAVLSDIIWEDVCRTHWPNTRLARRERSARHELQRLIDNLLREKVTHMERKKRKHYRIIKLNHRHEISSKSNGKTRDIIVANHENEKDISSRNNVQSDQTINRQLIFDAHNLPLQSRNLRSVERLSYGAGYPQTVLRSNIQDSSAAGPSKVVSNNKREVFTYCPASSLEHTNAPIPVHPNKAEHSLPNGHTAKQSKKNPRLVIKKTASIKKEQKETVNLEHYILLPTLVVKTPSNVKRQKRFNELYHRILNCDNRRSNSNTGDEQSNA